MWTPIVLYRTYWPIDGMDKRTAHGGYFPCTTPLQPHLWFGGRNQLAEKNQAGGLNFSVRCGIFFYLCLSLTGP
jgi:hypothetical protein